MICIQAAGYKCLESLKIMGIHLREFGVELGKVSEMCHLSPNGQSRATVQATVNDRNIPQGHEATANMAPTPG